MKRRALIAGVVAAVLFLVVFVTHERPIDGGDAVAVGRATIDLGEHVVAVLEPHARISYTVAQSMLRGERVEVRQLDGRAIYRVDARGGAHKADARGGSLVVRSAGGAVEVAREGGVAVFVVDGPHHVVAEGGAHVTIAGSTEDPSLLRTLDDVNNAPGGELVQRLAELLKMRAELEQERLRAPGRDAGRSRDAP